MRYSYIITSLTDEKQETIEEMSFKKMLKKLVLKFPKTKIICAYVNKKGKDIKRIIDTNKIRVKD
jgi:hypothetical protein|tara:strand:+ start:188 stop:382 length:195 start_codon:yes stop_codon:yes gene_type:complete